MNFLFLAILEIHQDFAICLQTEKKSVVGNVLTDVLTSCDDQGNIEWLYLEGTKYPIMTNCDKNVSSGVFIGLE